MPANLQRKHFFTAGSIALLVSSLSFKIAEGIPGRMDTKNGTVPEMINAAMLITIGLIVVFAGLYIYIH